MGLKSRRKGRSFEQKVAIALRAAFPGREVRRSLQSHRAYECDVAVDGVPVWWECNDCRAPDPSKKLAQACRDIKASSTMSAYRPVVVWHRLGSPRIQVTLRTSDCLYLWAVLPHPGLGELLGQAGDVEITLDFPTFVNWVAARNGFAPAPAQAA